MNNTLMSRDDFARFVETKKKAAALVVFCALFAGGFILSLIHPKLQEMYTDFKIIPPSVFANAPTIFIVIIVLSLGFIFNLLSKQHSDKTIDDLYLSYQNSLSVSGNAQPKLPFDKFAFMLIGLIIGFLVVSIITPIYNLTSSF